MEIKKKTIFITSSPQRTSVNNYFNEIGRELLLREFRVVFIFDKNYVREDDPKGLIYLTWPSRRPTKLKDFLFLRSQIRKYKPSHIISSFSAVNTCIITGFFCGVKNRIAWNHTLSKQLKKDFLGSKLNFLFLRLRKIIILNLFATEIHTNSKETKIDTNLFLKYSLKKIKVISFLLQTIDIDTTKKENVISFVSRFSPSKGQIVLVNSIKYILKKHPTYKFYFIGGGEETEILKLKEIVNKEKLVTNVVFLGKLSQKEVYKILSISKLHVSASIDEAFGMVNLEAIALNTPILTHEVGGIKDILEDGYNGYFFKMNDSIDLANKINKILDDSNLYNRLQIGTLDTFKNRFLLNKENLNKKIDLILS